MNFVEMGGHKTSLGRFLSVGLFERIIILVLILGLQLTIVQAWGGSWGSWGRKGGESEDSQCEGTVHEETDEALGTDREYLFDINSLEIIQSTRKGKELQEQSTTRMASASCWQHAYSSMAKSCKEILSDESQKSRLALQLTDCFLKTSGRRPLKHCAESLPVASCVRVLDDHVHSIYLAFYIDCAALCHYLQSEEFKKETERLVTNLKSTASETHQKLSVVNEQLDEQFSYVTHHTDKILQSQKQIQVQQDVLHTRLEEGITELQDATNEAAQEIRVVNKMQKDFSQQQQEVAESIHTELRDLQRKSAELGQGMTGLHSTVIDISEKTIAGHAETMKGFENLQSKQKEALEESRKSMKSLAEEAKTHHEEFGVWQRELDSMQKRIVERSKEIINAQVSIAEKQTVVVKTLEKLFSLHHVFLVESRLVKTTLVYFAAALVIFLLTTTKQTRNARVHLYFGLFVTFTFEFYLIRFKMELLNSNETTFGWPPRKITWIRYGYAGLTILYVLWCYLKFRDYEILNHKMLMRNMDALQLVKDKQDILREEILREVRKEVRGFNDNISSRTRSKSKSKCCNNCAKKPPIRTIRQIKAESSPF